MTSWGCPQKNNVDDSTKKKKKDPVSSTNINKIDIEETDERRIN